MVKTNRSCLGGCFSPLGDGVWGGAFPIFSKLVIISWEETKTTRICFFVAGDFVDLLFEQRLFLFIPPF